MARLSFWFIAILAIGQPVTPLLDLPGETWSPSLSPDGKRLAFNWCRQDFTDCGIYVRPFAGGEARLLVGKNKEHIAAWDVQFSPDGLALSFIRNYSHYDDHLIVRDVAGGLERDFGQISHESSVSWSPDSRFLAAGIYRDVSKSMDNVPALFSRETGKQIGKLANRGSDPVFSPGGGTVAYANGGSLMLVKIDATARPLGAPVAIAREVRDIANIHWMPDGKQLVYLVASDVPFFRRVEARVGARPQPIMGLNQNLSIGQILPDGSVLATETTRTEGFWRADLGAKPAKIETVVDPKCFGGAPWCSPDGHRQVYIDAPSGIAELWISNVDGSDKHRLTGPVASFTKSRDDDGLPVWISWSPDGRWIAFSVSPWHGKADIRNHLYVIPPSGGQPRRLGKEAYSLDFPVWAPDSKSLYAGQSWPFEDESHNGQSPIVRVDVGDGKITSSGAEGIWPHPSKDGGFLYFFTHLPPQLARIPIGGGAVDILSKAHNDWFTATVGAKYLYLFESLGGDLHSAIVQFDPALRLATELGQISFSPRKAYLSSDDNFLYFLQQENSKQRVVSVKGIF
jgi:Tol biopolymer transport system component